MIADITIREDGVMVIKGSGLTVAYVDQGALLGSVWRGDEEVENVSFINERFMEKWMTATINAIESGKI